MAYRDALANALARAERLAEENATLSGRLRTRRRFDFVRAILISIIVASVVAFAYVMIAPS